MTDYQLDEPSNKFVEFVRVRPSDFPFFPEAIILYNSTTRAFTVQLGFKMKDVRVANVRLLRIITTTGSTVTIIRKKRGNIQQRYKIFEGDGYDLEVTRTYLES